MKYSVKKGDNVLVLSGKDKGKQGEVLEVVRETGRVKVAGVNIQAHHKKPRSKDDKGGILKTEGAIDISNVQVVCPTCKKATRVAHSLVDGKSVRVCKKCGATLDGAKKAVKSTKPATKPAKTEKAEKAPKVEKVEAPKKEAKVEAKKPATKTAEKATKPAAKTTKAAAEKPATKTTKTTKTTTKTATAKGKKA